MLWTSLRKRKGYAFVSVSRHDLEIRAQDRSHRSHCFGLTVAVIGSECRVPVKVHDRTQQADIRSCDLRRVQEKLNRLGVWSQAEGARGLILLAELMKSVEVLTMKFLLSSRQQTRYILDALDAFFPASRSDSFRMQW